MQAKILIDNIGYDGLQGEWGLSVYMEYRDKRILLDAGASELFAENARSLGADISDVDYAVLSHAHYDHSLGMKKFFEINKKASFFLRESTAENCYAGKFIFLKYIGLPKKIISRYSDRITYVSGDYKLCEGVYLIPHHTPGLEAVGKREKMFQKINGRLRPDSFSHEQSLVFDTDKGLVIFNSCSHGGAANIIREVSQVFPDKRVYGLIGGFHLFNKKESEVRDLARKIKETGIQYICTGHCTKNRAFDILKEELGDSIHQMHVGMVMEF